MKRAIAALAVLAALVPVGVHSSGATFVAATANPGIQLSTAADFNTVAVALTDPGSPLRGTVTLSATAASDRGIASVLFQSAPAGTSAWSDVCTDSSAPYSCGFDTTSVADGLRDLRAVATDSAGYSRTDVVTDRRVDNTAPAVSTNDPGSPLTGTVTVGATATDAGSGLASATLQYRGSSGIWTDVCTQASSPVSCAWDTSSLADGLYDLHTVADDAAGNSATSAAVSNRRVDNTAPAVAMTDPGAFLRGSISLQSTSSDGAGSGVQSVTYEYKLSSGSTWTTACTAASTPFSCSWNTTGVANGLYDLRAVATDGVAKVTTSAAVTSRTIDNAAPTAVTLAAVATPLQGTVTLSGTATDAGSGIASVRFQTAPAGTTTWSDACTDATTPYSCTFDTTNLADALYDMRAFATDQAGNTTASATQTNRRIDNNGPTAVLNDPGPYLRGTVTISGTATDPAGVQSATFQYRAVGAPSWSTICTDTTSPYSCAGVNTTGLADGAYELRIQATDTLTHVSTSPVLTVQVDNTAPTGSDIQAANGGTAGTMDAGDSVTFTWSEPMAPASIMTAWAGGSTPVTVRITNNASNDRLDVFNAAGTLRLNTNASQLVQLQANWVSGTVWFNATMLRTGNQVAVTLGSTISGTPRTGVATTSVISWTPSTVATDLAGNPCSATVVPESGATDLDF
ncbi:MAG TPA: Ig-like domain-containing protein [Solirubrobacteraceae bacterium]|nr:Ig-like domain-containing protein [Solirubrobacteraceae bacterium]